MKCSGFERTQQSAQAMVVGLLDLPTTTTTTTDIPRHKWYPVIHTFSTPPSIFDRIYYLYYL